MDAGTNTTGGAGNTDLVPPLSFLSCLIDGLICPSDATILANPMPSNDDEEEMVDYGVDDETEEEAQQRLNLLRERRGPRFAQRHAACSTNDEDAEFTLVAFEQFRPFVKLLSFYTFNYTLKTWCYLSFLRWWVDGLANNADPIETITTSDGVVYAGALVVAWICVLGIILATILVNVCASETEPALTASDVKGQLASTGLDGLLRMFYSRNTSSQLAIEDVEKQYLQLQYQAQYAKNKLYYYNMEMATNRYFTFSEYEAEEVRELQGLVAQYEHGDFKLTSRKTQLLRAINALLWFTDLFMFAIDFNCFLRNAVGSPPILIMSVLLGLFAIIFPAWLAYQKLFMMAATKIFH